MNTLVLVGALLIVLVAMGMYFAIVSGNQAAKKQRTLAVIKGHSISDERGGSPAANAQEKRRAEISRKLKEKSEGDQKKKKKATTSLLLEQAGLNIGAKRFWIFSVLLSLACIVGSKAMGASPVVVIMLGITGLLGLPRFILRFRIKRRQKKFLEEFADALEAMVRLLKAGMPITEAISMASREFDGPVGEEMSRVYEAQKVGISLPEAALDAARRMPITEMQMFATGLSIQQQTGSSLSEVLSNLARVIRARFRLKRKIDALSAEAKASAGIIGSLPFLVGLGMYFINNDYLLLMFTTTLGRVMIIGGLTWMGIGVFIMKLMINFKV